MLDFMRVTASRVGTKKNEVIEIRPRFKIAEPKDLMIRGNDFYAIWDADSNIWSTDERDAIRLIDNETKAFADGYKVPDDMEVRVQYLWDASSKLIDEWHRYCQHQMRDCWHQLDANLIFAGEEVGRDDYATKHLPYSLKKGDISAYQDLVTVLYDPTELHKLEYAVGAIVSGDSKRLRKFEVLYGASGTGKSTYLNIVEMLFEGYCGTFDSRELASASNTFALEAFKSNPLVAIQQDGDLSRIEDNTKINSLVAHEKMTVNEKYHSPYTAKFNAFLFMGTNKPVRITDARSGLITRLIDVHPTGNIVPIDEYNRLMGMIPFELGAIAKHCLDVYKENPSFYARYTPESMLEGTNDFYDFMQTQYYIFKQNDGTTLKQAWEMYKTYVEESKVAYPMNKRRFRNELASYFQEYDDRHVMPDGSRVRNYYSGLKLKLGGDDEKPPAAKSYSPIELKRQKSVLDTILADCPAQYATTGEIERPMRKWENCTTTLKDIDTSKLHYVKVPENLIVIDFDIPNEDGEKDLEANLKAAQMLPPTYAETSKSGKGIHLHYIYDGDVDKLSRVYADNIEIKVYQGKSSLRRKLTTCNDLPVNHISGGLPLKKEGSKSMLGEKTIKSERGLRELLKRALNYDIWEHTKPSVDFIRHILDESYDSGLKYDVSDMRNAVLSFAAGSTHNSEYCLNQVAAMKFKSSDPSENREDFDEARKKQQMTFFDTEVFPNLFVICWKMPGDSKVQHYINPTPEEIEQFIHLKLVGFNNRRYDNHILYARLMGYTNEQLYNLSQKIVNGDRDALFGEAYNISYTDVYDFMSAAHKMSLKKWEIKLGIHHEEWEWPWDQPVPEELWNKVVKYCEYDVKATEETFNDPDVQGDWVAREILADLAEMTVNDTTNQLTTKIIFEGNKHPQLVYTDLATGKQSDPAYQNDSVIQAFPGYTYENGHNMFRGVDVGRGGYVYAEPGMYENVLDLDVSSLHPHSAIAMNCFGEYTKNFSDLVDARVFIKHGNYDAAGALFNGKLKKYLTDEKQAKALAGALKTAINSVYGMTSATYPNAFRDIRNKNNIVALRGALFMKTLQDEVAAKGYTVVHIKTDSIKIADADEDIQQFCMDFAKKYGYEFEVEARFKKICLVNNAVFIAKNADTGEWQATGAQFAEPYVYKTLFTHEKIGFDDLCVTKSVSGGAKIYLDMNEDLTPNKEVEKEISDRWEQRKKEAKRGKVAEAPKDYIDAVNPAFKDVTDDELKEISAKDHRYKFVGRIGQFCPIKKGKGGGVMIRSAVDQKTGQETYSAPSGTKGYRWQEAEIIRGLDEEDKIDKSYFQGLVDDAVDNISKYGDFEQFVA